MIKKELSKKYAIDGRNYWIKYIDIILISIYIYRIKSNSEWSTERILFLTISLESVLKRGNNNWFQENESMNHSLCVLQINNKNIWFLIAHLTLLNEIWIWNKIVDFKKIIMNANFLQMMKRKHSFIWNLWTKR